MSTTVFISGKSKYSDKRRKITEKQFTDMFGIEPGTLQFHIMSEGSSEEVVASPTELGFTLETKKE